MTQMNDMEYQTIINREANKQLIKHKFQLLQIQTLNTLLDTLKDLYTDGTKDQIITFSNIVSRTIDDLQLEGHSALYNHYNKELRAIEKYK